MNGAMLVMFDADTVVYPKESEWFWEMEADGSVTKVEDTDFYKNDNIGLKALNEAGKVQFLSFPGQHLTITDDQIDNIISPFLMS